MNIDITKIGELNPPERILMGPGPSNVHPRVLRAMSTPLIGHLDPDFLVIMNELQELLRYTFKTKNRFTIAISGTGSSGMEACVCNTMERGQKMIVGVNGVFGMRLVDTVQRYGGVPIEVKAEWGRIIDPDDIKKALKEHPDAVGVIVVHAETSTGAKQPLEEIGRICRDQDKLFIVDTVTSLSGTDVRVDDWLIDVCYSGTQKCLSCPPGLSPFTMSDRAIARLHARKTKVESWYLDMAMIEKYWGSERVYHHTAPISMVYALREALRLIAEEGLENRFQRHQRCSDALKAGLESMGISYVAQEGHRLPMLNAVTIPDGVQDAAFRRTLLQKYGIEIGAGLGPFVGKVWRIGLMGYTCNMGNVLYLLDALREELKRN